MNKKAVFLKISLSVIVLGIASLSLISEELSKFILLGKSSTYDGTLIRYSPLVVFTISFIVVFLIFLFKKSNLHKCLLGVFLLVWLLSQRTYVVDTYEKKVISGFAIIPLYKNDTSSKGIFKLDFLMRKRVEEAVGKDSQNQ